MNLGIIEYGSEMAKERELIDGFIERKLDWQLSGRVKACVHDLVGGQDEEMDFPRKLVPPTVFLINVNGTSILSID